MIRTIEKRMTMDQIRKLFLPTGVTKALYAFGATLLLAVLDLETAAFAAFLLTIFFLYAYRNPKRTAVDLGDYGIVSPVDGKVVSIENIAEDTYGFKVTIESGVLDAGVLKAPFDAELQSVELFRGTRLSKSSVLFEKLNERCELLFVKAHKKVRIVHVLKRSVLDAECMTEASKEVTCCTSYGFAYCAQTTLYLPKEFRLNISVGTKLLAAQNIIGYFSK